MITEKELNKRLNFIKWMFWDGSRPFSIRIPIGNYRASMTIIYNFFRKGKKVFKVSFSITQEILNEEYIGGSVTKYIWDFPKSRLTGMLFGFKLPLGCKNVKD